METRTSRYRDTNLLMSYKPGDTDSETVRVATLGALRFGKPLVVDNGDLPLDWATMASWFDSVRAGLWDMLWDGSIVKDANFLKLATLEDGDNFKEVRISTCFRRRVAPCVSMPHTPSVCVR